MKETKRMSAAQRRARQRKQRNRRIAMTVALVLVVALASIGGTIAWLTDSTTPVTNTFTTAGIDITLTETMNTDTDSDGVADKWTAQLVPGKEYPKNPVVSVVRPTTDVDIYLFVKVEDTASAYLDYTSNLNTQNGWTQGMETDGIPTTVWYRTVGANETTTSWHLIKDDKVTVNSTIVKPDNDASTLDMPSGNVELKYTAYAIQTEGFANAAAAWAKIGN